MSHTDRDDLASADPSPSRAEALEWLKRAPFDGGVEIELRQIFEADDFGEQLTPELREANERLREQTAQN